MVADSKSAPRKGARRNGFARALFAFTATATIAGGIVGAGGASPAWAADASVAPTPETVRAQGYNKVSFQDEFDGTSLDTSKWGYQYGCFDPAQHSQAQYTDSPDNVAVHDGHLSLTARYSPTKTKWDGSQVPRTCKNGDTTYDAPFTSGMITTKTKDGKVLYAAPGTGFYAEARVKLPAGRSSWAAFWGTGTKGGWPANGEIDIFESKGYDPSFLMSNIHTPRAGNPKKTQQHQGAMHGDTASSQTEWHTYGLLKTADAIEFYFDGQMTHRVKMSDIKGASNPFADPDNNLVLKLNHMVGGSYLAKHDNWSDKTYVDATKYISDYEGAGSEMLVDYVRVWEKDPNAPTVTETPAPEPTANPAPAPEPTANPAPAPEPTVNPAPAPEPTAEPAPAPSTEPTKPADNNAGNATDVDTGHPGEGTPATRPVENTTGDNGAAEKPDTPSVNDNAATGDANKPGDKPADKQPETPAPSADKPSGNNGADKPAHAPEPSRPAAQPETPGTSATPNGNNNVASKPGEATQGKGEGHEQPFRTTQQAASEAGTGSRQVGAAGGSQGVGVHSASALPSTGGNVLVLVASAGALVAAVAVGLAALVVNRANKRG